MIVLIDNYDSFSFNLYQQIGTLTGLEPVVLRNDAATVSEIIALGASHIVLSPGPGTPSDAGVCVELVRQLPDGVALLGVCLGHQAICEAFGATVAPAQQLLHGKAAPCRLDTTDRLFAGLPPVVSVGRYHSLAVLAQTMPLTLGATAWADDGEIMAVAHITRPIFGVQFHPESILTPQGDAIMANFLQCARHPSSSSGVGGSKTDMSKSMSLAEDDNPPSRATVCGLPLDANQITLIRPAANQTSALM